MPPGKRKLGAHLSLFQMEIIEGRIKPLLGESAHRDISPLRQWVCPFAWVALQTHEDVGSHAGLIILVQPTLGSVDLKTGMSNCARAKCFSFHRLHHLQLHGKLPVQELPYATHGRPHNAGTPWKSDPLHHTQSTGVPHAGSDSSPGSFTCSTLHMVGPRGFHVLRLWIQWELLVVQHGNSTCGHGVSPKPIFVWFGGSHPALMWVWQLSCLQFLGKCVVGMKAHVPLLLLQEISHGETESILKARQQALVESIPSQVFSLVGYPVGICVFYYCQNFMDAQHVLLNSLAVLLLDLIPRTNHAVKVTNIAKHVIHVNQKLGHVTVAPLRAGKAQPGGARPLLPGLHILHVYTRLKNGSNMVSVVVGNMSDTPIFLKKGVQIARMVSAMPVPPPSYYQRWRLPWEQRPSKSQCQCPHDTKSSWRSWTWMVWVNGCLRMWLPPGISTGLLWYLCIGQQWAGMHQHVQTWDIHWQQWAFQGAVLANPSTTLEEVCASLQDMLDVGAMWPSQSQWCNVVVLACKKDRALHFCVDFPV